uniref:DOMON domain-containing protein n=1 Tax=Tetraselmis chuii TaxID=63592 RepID=A0A7S1SXQ3_9CHLO
MATAPLPIDVEGGRTHWIWGFGGTTFGMHTAYGSGLSAAIPTFLAVEAPTKTPVPTETPPPDTVGNALCVDGPFEVTGAAVPYQCALDFDAGGASDGRLLWTHDGVAGTVDFALCVPAEGWVSVGFQTAENANSMTGALAVIGTPDGVEGYRLNSRSLGDVVPDDATTSSLSAPLYESSDGMALLTFTVDLTSTPLPIDPEDVTHFIWALSDSDSLNTHSARGHSLSITLAAGANAPLPSPPQISNSSEKVHGVLMALAWVFLLPMGAAISKYIPLLGKKAYLTHLAMQMTGVALTIASLVFILIDKELPSTWLTTDGKRYDHGRVGIAVVAFAIFNPINAMLRPHPGVSLQRRAWEIAHLVIGKTALYLGAFNVFFGIYVYTVLNQNEGGDWAPWIGLCVFALCAVCMGVAIADKLIRHRADMAKVRETATPPLEDNKLASDGSGLEQL